MRNATPNPKNRLDSPGVVTMRTGTKLPTSRSYTSFSFASKNAMVRCHASLAAASSYRVGDVSL